MNNLAKKIFTFSCFFIFISVFVTVFWENSIYKKVTYSLQDLESCNQNTKKYYQYIEQKKIKRDQFIINRAIQGSSLEESSYLVGLKGLADCASQRFGMSGSVIGVEVHPKGEFSSITLERKRLFNYWFADLSLMAFISVSISIMLLVVFSKVTILQIPPASRLIKIAEFIPKRYQVNLEQEISDMRLEYYEALSEKNIWRAKCIIVFYYIGLIWTVVLWFSDKIKKIIGILPKVE